MPKMKSNRGAAKRFRATASGFKCRSAGRRHNTGKLATKRKRHLRTTCRVGKSDQLSIARMLLQC